jgi:tetratricopeptide (TPR) repeat protein
MNETTQNQVTAATSKTVFALRKEGRLDEALQMGRELFHSPHIDIWGVRAFGWVLHDLVKKALKEGRRDQANELFKELDALSLGDGDEILIKQRDFLREQVSEKGAALSQAVAASKAGNHAQATTLYRQAVREMPDSKEAQTGLAWELFRELNSLVKHEGADMARFRAILGEYADLTLVEKPSRIHSMMLSVAIRVADHFPTLPAFVRWWNVATLMPGDWLEQKGEGESVFPSLAAKLVKALNKVIKTGDHLEDLPWITEFTGMAVERLPDEPWFPYYYGKLLIKQGLINEAREWVLPVIRRKTREFWAWDVLASTYGAGDEQLRMACLAKALLCHAQDESFKINVMMEMAQAMVMNGDYAEAKHELERIVAIRAARGWKTPESIVSLQRQPWYATSEVAADNREYYTELAPQAETLVFEGLPWLDGVVSGRIKSEPGVKPGVFILFRKDNANQELRVNPKGFACLRTAPLGSTVSVRAITAEGRDLVVEVKLREGQSWDLLTERPGVVSHVNRDKGVAAITVGMDTVVLAYFDQLPEAAELLAGDCLMLRSQPMPEGRPSRLVCMRKVRELPEGNFVRQYQGEYRRDQNGMFGFVGDVYISAELGGDLNDVDMAAGIAVYETNKKTGRKGWRALTVQDR